MCEWSIRNSKIQFITRLKVGMKDFLMHLRFSQNVCVKIHISMFSFGVITNVGRLNDREF